MSLRNYAPHYPNHQAQVQDLPTKNIRLRYFQYQIFRQGGLRWPCVTLIPQQITIKTRAVQSYITCRVTVYAAHNVFVDFVRHHHLFKLRDFVIKRVRGTKIVFFCCEVSIFASSVGCTSSRERHMHQAQDVLPSFII